MKKMKIISVLFVLIIFAIGSQESFSQSLRGLVNEGVENYNEGNFSDAEVKFKKGVEKSPESFEAKFNLGVIAVSLGDKEKARKIWTELAENNPGSEASEYAKEALKKL